MNPEPVTTPQPDQKRSSAELNPGPLPAIPIPPEQQWRHFRITVLPFLMFGGVLGLTIWLWGRNLATPMAIGEVEGLQAAIVTPKAGRLVAVNTVLYQEVKAGDVVALVDVVEPSVRSNTLAVIRAEMDLIKAESGFNGGDRVRYSQFKLDWMMLGIAQALDTLAVPVQEAELNRSYELFKSNYISISIMESNKLLVDQLKLRVEKTPTALTDAGKALNELNPIAEGQQTKSVQAALALAEKRLELAEAENQPIPLRAPISGRVDKLEVLAGSSIAAGSVIMNISSAKAERIVGYIHQPVRIEPKIGMKVTVRSRGVRRETAQAEILSVGARVDLLTASLRTVGLSPAQELALPVVLSVPQKMPLRPGELVDLTLLIE